MQERALIALVLKMFVGTYKTMRNIKLKLAIDHIFLVVEIHW